MVDASAFGTWKYCFGSGSLFGNRNGGSLQGEKTSNSSSLFPVSDALDMEFVLFSYLMQAVVSLGFFYEQSIESVYT